MGQPQADYIQAAAPSSPTIGQTWWDLTKGPDTALRIYTPFGWAKFGQFPVLDSTNMVPSAQLPTGGSGDMTKAVYDPAAKNAQLVVMADLHANTNDPSADQKAALAGTSGVPSVTNKYVTDADAHNTNARTPLSTLTHGDAAHNALTYEASGAVATHTALATGVHGAGASTLETVTGSAAKVTTHDAHTQGRKGGTTNPQDILNAPVTHASQGGHAHDAHSAHAGTAVDAHSAHDSPSHLPPWFTVYVWKRTV